MPVIPEYPLEIFYDGSCRVCNAKMESYRREIHGGRLDFTDISLPEFDPTPYGITLAEFMYEMHAIDRRGRVYRGVEALSAVWLAFPASVLYTVLGRLVTMPGVGYLARLAYRGFARIRRYLPKKNDACRDGSCRTGRAGPLF